MVTKNLRDKVFYYDVMQKKQQHVLNTGEMLFLEKQIKMLLVFTLVLLFMHSVKVKNVFCFVFLFQCRFQIDNKQTLKIQFGSFAISSLLFFWV